MKTFVSFIILLIASTPFSRAQTYLISSPDGNIQFQLSAGKTISYSLIYRGGIIVSPSDFSLAFSQSPVFGKEVSVIRFEEKSVQDSWKPVIGEVEQVESHYNELVLDIAENNFPRRKISFKIRVYNDGVAFRYQIPESWSRFIPNYQSVDYLTLSDEISTFAFPKDRTAWVADYGSYDTHQETEFLPKKLQTIDDDALIGLPLLIKIHDRLYTAITEADLTDWAGMYLRVMDDDGQADLIRIKTDLSPLTNGSGRVRVKPGQYSPWRVIMLAETPGKLIESQIIQDLNDSCAIEDPSWIKPGISAWDHWWSGEVKMDTETIKKYIQLASDMDWEYMLIDWHWYGAPFTSDGEFKASPSADITTVNPDVNMPEVIEFASERKVKLLLWLLWEHVDKQMDEAFPLYEKWGIAGVKIDFMARDDQDMVNWYHKVVKKAAEHKLTVDFHGAYKPTGWSRTYPNLLTREGVLGNEYSKWSSRITPEHNVTLPFTRMLAGQMDYTPGAFLNVKPENFKTGKPAMVMNTRAHQLAMFVVYYSPLTVACDHPDHYRDKPGIEFLKQVPTVWDDTRVLAGEVGKYIVIARRKGDRWFIGAMNNSEPRGITVKLDFMEKRNNRIHYFGDAAENQLPSSLSIGSDEVMKGQYYFIKMAAGGGFAAWID